MPKRKLLIVAQHEFTTTVSNWAEKLEKAGYECHCEPTMLGAIDYLRKHGDMQLLVQENLPFQFMTPTPREIPSELALVRDKSQIYERGAAFIQYARSQGLISSETPAFLAVCDRKGRYDPLPPYITKCIDFGPEGVNVAAEMRPAHAPAAATGNTSGKNGRFS